MNTDPSIETGFTTRSQADIEAYAQWAYEAAQRFAQSTKGHRPMVWTEEAILAAEEAELAAAETARAQESERLTVKLATRVEVSATDEELIARAEKGDRHADRLLRIRGL